MTKTKLIQPRTQARINRHFRTIRKIRTVESCGLGVGLRKVEVKTVMTEYQASWEESYGDKWVKKTLARPTAAKCRYWLDHMYGYPSIYRNMRVEKRTVTEWAEAQTTSEIAGGKA